MKVLGAVAVALLLLLGGCSDSSSSGEPDEDDYVELDAVVGTQPDPPGIELRNESDERWTDCEVSLNAGLIRSGYKRTVDVLEGGDLIGLPYPLFIASDGQRFDITERAVQEVWLQCETPRGTGFASFEPKN